MPLLGYTKAELIQMTWEDLTHPDDLAADLAQFKRVMAGEVDGYTLEKRFLKKTVRSSTPIWRFIACETLTERWLILWC
ncbi:MAG: PAS domain-containing protein [Anaerolineales bacterium]|nr:PAS domain-containing protein [Anaerolineales bacterium]